MNRKKWVNNTRAYLYKDNFSFASDFVEARLDDGSLVPTDVRCFPAVSSLSRAHLCSVVKLRNIFSVRLSEHGFDLFRMLVVDIMHEVELGVWKAVFIHLLCLLKAVKKGTINVVDARLVPLCCGLLVQKFTHSVCRYRNMPTFGRDTIRQFVNNVSEMRQLAACDFKDLLQVSIRVF